MSDYISREAASVLIEGEQKKLCPVGLWGRKFAADADKYDMLQEMLDKIEAIPATDVEPVRRGRWVRPHWRNSSYCCDCSECGGDAMHREYQWNKKGIYPICPNCGSKMDLEDDNGT